MTMCLPRRNDEDRRPWYATVVLASLLVAAMPLLHYYDCRASVPAETLLQELVTAVEDLNLRRGIDNSLDAKLEAARRVVENQNDHNHVAAVNIMLTFINAVEAQRGDAILEEDADLLVNKANEVILAVHPKNCDSCDWNCTCEPPCIPPCGGSGTGV